MPISTVFVSSSVLRDFSYKKDNLAGHVVCKRTWTKTSVMISTSSDALCSKFFGTNKYFTGPRSFCQFGCRLLDLLSFFLRCFQPRVCSSKFELTARRIRVTHNKPRLKTDVAEQRGKKRKLAWQLVHQNQERSQGGCGNSHSLTFKKWCRNFWPKFLIFRVYRHRRRILYLDSVILSRFFSFCTFFATQISSPQNFWSTPWNLWSPLKFFSGCTLDQN